MPKKAYSCLNIVGVRTVLGVVHGNTAGWEDCNPGHCGDSHLVEKK